MLMLILLNWRYLLLKISAHCSDKLHTIKTKNGWMNEFGALFVQINMVNSSSNPIHHQKISDLITIFIHNHRSEPIFSRNANHSRILIPFDKSQAYCTPKVYEFKKCCRQIDVCLIHWHTLTINGYSGTERVPKLWQLVFDKFIGATKCPRILTLMFRMFESETDWFWINARCVGDVVCRCRSYDDE